MAKIKLIGTIVFLVLFLVSISANIIMFVLIRNNEQKIELTGLRRENERLKRQAEINSLYVKKIKSIKKEREYIYSKIKEAGTDEEILNIVSDIVNYNNFLVSDDSGE